MYRPFFGLQERPFDLTPNPRFLILTDGHREALSTLEYGISSRKGITLLVGEAGTGKTTLIRAAAGRQPERVHCVHLHNPALTRDEFVETLATSFGLPARAGLSKASLLTELETMLRQRHAAGDLTVLIVDEAQSIPLELLEEIRLLANIETDDSKLLSVILAGQPELAARLNQGELRQLKQRVALRCELRPLSEMETIAYIAGRLRAAGGVAGQIFTREAVRTIYARSGGIPRTISVIADNALVTGFALGRKPVTNAMVEEVCRDFDLQPKDLDDRATPQTPVAGAADPTPAPAAERRISSLSIVALDSAAGEPAARPVNESSTETETGVSDGRKRRRFSFF